MSANEIAAVNEAVDALAKAMVAGDRAKMTALTSSHLSYGHSAGLIETQAQFVENIAGGNNVFKRIDQSDKSVVIANATTAIARQTFDAEAVNAGKTMTPHLGVLQVWTKDGGAWKLLARQAFKL